jgi:hypothetical protein
MEFLNREPTNQGDAISKVIFAETIRRRKASLVNRNSS